MSLQTTYLGLQLTNPFIVGASPLADSLDSVKRLEDAGAAAIVLRSLFEEQITMAESAQIHHRDPVDQEFAAALAAFPAEGRYVFSPNSYLEHVQRVKRAVSIPVVASLNGMTCEAWVRFAKNIEAAGADALELNLYEMATDPAESGAALEARIRDLVLDLKSVIEIPVAVKLGPFFTAFGHFAHELSISGVDGLVIFNRFLQADIDADKLVAAPQATLSTSAELLLRLRWLSALREHVRCSLAVTGGVATPLDGIKAILCGADAVQMVSAILRHGPDYLRTMRAGLTEWMAGKELETISDVKRAMQRPGTNADLFERGAYLQALQSWRFDMPPPH